jgi:hypothetical protein
MPRFRWFRWALLALLLGVVPVAQATPSEHEDKLITALIERVAKMTTMKFMRNGGAHSSTEAAEHMQAKYAYFKNEIVTAEDFIERCATRSELTGQPYTVKLGNDQEREANAFLQRELRALRKELR